MFEVNGLMIQAEGIDIVEEVRNQLSANGIQLLHTIRMGNGNVQFSCPSHKNGQEKKPSCGMSLTPTYKGGRLIPAGTVHCFTCGYTASLPEFISHCFGKEDAGMFGNRWLKKNYTALTITTRQPVTLNMSRGVNNVNKPVEKLVIPESVLDSYRYYHDYMYERKLTDEIIDLFDVGFDKKTQCITFPVKDLDGDVVFVQTRSVKTKFHHYAAGVNKTDYIYGAYEVLKYFPDATDVAICESILNALTLWTLGIPAVALMGVGGGKQYDILASLPFRCYTLALDPDPAGQEAMDKIIKRLRRKKVLFKYIYPDNRDINDLGDAVLELEKVLV